MSQPQQSAREPSQTDLQQTILQLLAARGSGNTICPSEVARAAAGSERRPTWEPLLPLVREAAQALETAGAIVVTQRGHIVSSRVAKGPVRFRRA